MRKKLILFTILHICLSGKMLQAQVSTYKRSAEISRQLLQYDVSFYKLDVSISNTSNYISGNGNINAKVVSAELDTFAFELHQDLVIDSIYINAKKYLVSNQRSNGEVQVKLQNSLPKNADISAQIFYHGNPPSTVNTWKLGLINETDTEYNVKITHSLSVPYSAYAWWPCKQVVTDLADSIQIFVTSDTSLKVASNGKLSAVKELGNGKHRFEWKSNYPINYYLVSVAVAPYFINNYSAELDNGSKTVHLQDFIYDTKSGRAEAEVSKSVSPPIMQNFSEMFGIYPFADEKYGIYSAPVSGGMEHQTMSAIGDITDKYLLAHEMAHQWFGDNVNLVSYRDMWLNEGFASYAEYLAAEKLWPADAPIMMNSYHNYAMSKTGGSVYVSDTLVFENLYEGRLVYRKGAAILHTMRFLVNDDMAFFGAIKSFQHKYSGKSIRAVDFKNHMETETGTNLDDFFRQWYYGEGYPTFAVTWNHKNNELILKTTQTTSTTKTKIFKTPFELLVKRVEGDTIIRLNQDTNTNYFHISMPGTVSGITFDPNNWILNRVKSVIKDTELSAPGTPGKKSGYNFRVYPNPAGEKLYITSSENAFTSARNLQISVNQIDGKLCITKNFTEPQTIIDLDFLASGIYFLNIKGDQVNFRQKIVKN